MQTMYNACYIYIRYIFKLMYIFLVLYPNFKCAIFYVYLPKYRVFEYRTYVALKLFNFWKLIQWNYTFEV